MLIDKVARRAIAACSDGTGQTTSAAWKTWSDRRVLGSLLHGNNMPLSQPQCTLLCEPVALDAAKTALLEALFSGATVSVCARRDWVTALKKVRADA